MQLSVRLKPALAARLEAHCKSKGLTKSEAVAAALERALGSQTANSYELLEELTANLQGLPDTRASENVSRKVKAKLRAQHNR